MLHCTDIFIHLKKSREVVGSPGWCKFDRWGTLDDYTVWPFSRSSLSSLTVSFAGFSLAHTAASWYPSSKSLSRISSAAGSSAQLKSWHETKGGDYNLLLKRKGGWWGCKNYLPWSSPVLRVAVRTNSNTLQTQETGRKCTNTHLKYSIKISSHGTLR